MGFAPGNLQKLLEILEEDGNVDAIAMEVGASFIARRLRENPALLDQLVETLASHKNRSAKPFVAIAHPGHVEDVMADIRARLIARGIAVFGSFQAGAQALRRTIDYWRARRDLN